MQVRFSAFHPVTGPTNPDVRVWTAPQIVAELVDARCAVVPDPIWEEARPGQSFLRDVFQHHRASEDAHRRLEAAKGRLRELASTIGTDRVGSLFRERLVLARKEGLPVKHPVRQFCLSMVRRYAPPVPLQNLSEPPRRPRPR